MFFNSFFRYFLYLTGTKFILAPPVSKQLETLSSSLSELSQAGNELSQQYQTLVTGSKSLSEGMSLFDQEGIQKITDMTTIKKLKEKDQYSGLSGNNITNTKFIFEMAI